MITTLDDAPEVHPDAFVTVNVYVPVASPEIEVVVPVPVVLFPPGDLVIVHDPAEGKPLRSTLPVAAEHVGCVIVPTIGADGIAG